MIEQTFSASKAAGTFFVQNWLGSVYFHVFQWAKKGILLILVPRIINVFNEGPKMYRIRAAKGFDNNT